MTIYFLLIALIIFLGICLKKTPKQKIIYSLLIFIFIILIVGLRKYTIGNDTENYVKFFHNVSMNSFNTSRFEYGYILLNVFVRKFTDNYTVLLLFFAAIMNYSICKFITKNSENMCLSFLLFVLVRFLFDEMNVVRQVLAISIILLSLKHVKNRNFFRFLIYVLLATLMHSSAVVTFVLYFLYNKELSKKSIMIFSGFSVVAFVFFSRILNLFTSIFTSYTDYVESFYGSNKLASFLSFFMYLCIFVFITILRKKMNKQEIDINKKKDNNFYYNVLFLTTILSFLSFRISILNRISMYFEIFIIITIPNYIKYITNHKNRALCNVLIVILFTIYFFIILYYRPNWNNVVPYKFHWQ